MAYQATGYNPEQVPAGKFLDHMGKNRVNVIESDLVHLDHSGETPASAFSALGDPVSFGTGGIGVIVGGESSTAETDNVVVQTDGVVHLSVVASDNVGTAAINIGDLVFIQANGTVSVDIVTAGNKRFGVALNDLAGSATGAPCAVKLSQNV